MKTGRSLPIVRWAFLLLFLPAIAFSAETKDLSPPPLNPHPQKTLHVTVSFDRPEHAERYIIIMKALYHNRQEECGYFGPHFVRRFFYPEKTVVVANRSSDPRRAKFDIHLDRYKRDSCNWELAWPDFVVRDTFTGKELTGEWGRRDDLTPGTTYRTICPFRNSEFARSCFGRQPVPDSSLYRMVPESRRVPVTVHVSKDSAPLPADRPDYLNSAE